MKKIKEFIYKMLMNYIKSRESTSLSYGFGKGLKIKTH